MENRVTEIFIINTGGSSESRVTSFLDNLND